MIAEFAQIVGLLSAYTSGRQSAEILSIAEFLQWLTDHNHAEIRKIVEQNTTTTISIKAILNNNLDTISQMLQDISEQIAILASRTNGIEELAASFANQSISEQAIEILSLMDENKAEFFLLLLEAGSQDQTLVLVPGPNYVCKESRFIKDDLDLMTRLGLLTKDYNSNGKPMYYMTRAASNLISSMK